MRILWWLLLALALVWLYRSWRGSSGGAGTGGSPAGHSERSSPGTAASKPRAPQPMLRCAHCGVHLPSSDVLTSDGLPYCSAAHRDAGPAAPAQR